MAAPRLIALPSKRAKSFDPKLFLTRIGKGKSTKEYQHRQTIFAQGDPADAVYYIQSGKIKLTVVSKRGKEAVIALVDQGDFFGEGCLAGQRVRMCTATAVHDHAIVVRVDKATMLRTIHQRSEFAELFITYLLSRNIRIEEDLVDQLFNSSEKRLARLLLMLAQYGKGSKEVSVVAKMSQETLAEMIGTTRSRVSFFMNRFRKMGFIDYNGELHVYNSLLNVVLRD